MTKLEVEQTWPTQGLLKKKKKEKNTDCTCCIEINYGYISRCRRMSNECHEEATNPGLCHEEEHRALVGVLLVTRTENRSLLTLSSTTINRPPFECRRRHRQSSFNPLNVLLSAPNCLRIATSALYFRFVTSIVFTVVILPRFSSRRVFGLNCLNCFQDILRRNGHRGVRVGPCFQL